MFLPRGCQISSKVITLDIQTPTVWAQWLYNRNGFTGVYMHSLHLQSTEEKRGGESTFSNNSNSNLADPMLVHPELLRLLMRNIIIMSLEEDLLKGLQN